MAGGGLAGRRIHPWVLVADHDRDSRAQIVGQLARLGCVADEAATGEQALAAARRDPPALVVLDVHLPGISGYEVCRELRDSFGEALPIIFVSDTRIDPTDEVAGLLLGADYYLTKPIVTDHFLACVRRILARTAPRAISAGSLTPREREVLALMVGGVRRAEIAAELCITPKTTATHIEHILRKLGAHSQAQAIAFAVRDGLVEARPSRRFTRSRDKGARARQAG